MKLSFRYLYKLFKVTILVFLCSCSSGHKAYQRGDYYQACSDAIQRLKSDPGKRKARETLQNAYPLCVDNAVRQAGLNTASRNLQHLEGNIALYDRMNRLADDIRHSPGALAIIAAPREFHTELRETLDLVAGLYYEEGMAAMRAGTLEGARAAVEFFSKTAHYAPNYRDVQSRLGEARYAATVRVVVTRPATNRRYQLDADFFYHQFMQEVTGRTYRYLIRFYTPQEAAAEKMTSPHQVIALDFEDFTVGNSHSSTNTREYHRDSIVVGTTKVNGRNQNVYGTVRAQFTLNRLEIISAGVLGIRIMEPAASRMLDQKNLAGRFVWYTEWASYNGDQRALSREQLALVNRKPLPVPPPQEHFRGFAMPLYAQAADYISTVYARIYGR